VLLQYTHKNLTTCQQNAFATDLWQACQQVVTMLLFYQVATRLSLTTRYQVVELQDDNKLLEQPVTSLLRSTTLYQVVNKSLKACQQAGNKHCSVASLLQLVRFYVSKLVTQDLTGLYCNSCK
jgi:hypothetical protein